MQCHARMSAPRQDCRDGQTASAPRAGPLRHYRAHISDGSRTIAAFQCNYPPRITRSISVMDILTYFRFGFFLGKIIMVINIVW